LFVVGTAGHVDHGKSTLVKALTGIDPDRLEEEKVREMTIDLGFAWLTLPSGLQVSIIDVPGHEHFIKNMLAGVSGLDLALLVVAAPESVRQQTREHLAILDLMEVPLLIAVITQADMADADQVTLVSMEIEDVLKPTRFAGSLIMAVSSTTGQGLEELKAIIDKVLSTATPRRDIGKPRLPVDRIFSITGAGTVVTGTLIDGSLKLGEEIEILPPGLKSRIRGIQAHKTQLNCLGPGNRAALNLVGLSSTDLKRGCVLVKPGWLTSTTVLDAKLRLLDHIRRPLQHNTEVSFHAGSAEEMGRVRLLEKAEILPGETSWVQFILDNPLALVNGDHYVIRSPMDTLGGGVVVEAHPKERHRRFRTEVIENLQARGEGKLAETVLASLKAKQPQEMGSLISQSGLSQEVAQSVIEELVDEGRVVKLGEGDSSLLYTDTNWLQVKNIILSLISDYHRKFPLRQGITKAEISSKIKLGSHFSAALEMLSRQGALVEESTWLRLPDYKIRPTQAQQIKLDSFLKQLTQNPYSPEPDIALEADLLNLVLERGQAIKTSSGIVFSSAAFDEMVCNVMERIKSNGKITLGEARDMFKNSRKYAQALLDTMDERKLTKRVGDDRVAGDKSLNP
jgi:selenocysteine-specific elongation factor